MIQETSELTLFESTEFGTLRTVQKDGEAWFVAADVCRVLGLGNPTMALERLDEDEKALISIEGLSRGNEVGNIINEPGLYVLILGSRKKQARAFRRWITHEVIPAIRRTGFYAPTEQTLSDRLSPREQLRAAKDVSGLLKSINHVMSLQGSPSRKIASTVKGICEHYGIPLPSDFVEPERVSQATAVDMNEAHLERIRRRIISAEELRQAEERARRDAFKTVSRMREEFEIEMSRGGA